MTKLELVTREVWRIVRENSPNFHKTRMINEPELAFFAFNTISGRHEIECFFAIEFEQEQVDAWTTVQNIIDDVMNLWVSPITDPVVHKIGMGKTYGQFGAEPETVQRLQRQLGESEKAFEERVKHAINPSKSGVVGHIGEEAVIPPFRMENGHLMVNPAFMSKPGRLDPPTEAERAAAAKKPSEAINRIERADVERFAALRVRPSSHHDNLLNEYQRIATKSAIYPGKGTPFGLMYAALGLAEAGEVQNKVKKAFRDDGAISFHPLLDPGPNSPNRVVNFQPLPAERRAQIIKELGGVLWYVAAVCDEIGATMSEVALQNLEELCGRGERNTLRGDGDNR